MAIPARIDVLFVLSPARVQVKRGGICHVASGVIGHNGDVIAYLVLFGQPSRGLKGLLTATFAAQVTPPSVL